MQQILAGLSDVGLLRQHAMQLRPPAIVESPTVDTQPDARPKSLSRLSALCPWLPAEVGLKFRAQVSQLWGGCPRFSPERAAPAMSTDPGAAYGRSQLLGNAMMISSGASPTLLRLPGALGRNGPKPFGIDGALADAAPDDGPLTLKGVFIQRGARIPHLHDFPATLRRDAQTARTAERSIERGSTPPLAEAGV